MIESRVLTAMTFTKVVFPEYCSPTNVSSISSFQKRADKKRYNENKGNFTNKLSHTFEPVQDLINYCKHSHLFTSYLHYNHYNTITL